MKLSTSAAILAAIALPGLALAQTSTVSSMTSDVLSGFYPSTVARNSANWYDDRWYVTPFGSYISPDSGRHTSSGFRGFGLALGKPINPWVNVELRGSGETMNAKSWNYNGNGNFPGYKFDNWSVELDAQWFFLGRAGFNNASAIQPYLVAGIGAINDKASSTAARIGGTGSSTNFMGSAGVGVVWPVTNWARIVVDARYRIDTNQNDLAMNRGNFGDWLITAGVQIPLGAVPEVAVPPAPRVVAPPPPPAPMPAPVVVAPAVVPAPMPAPAIVRAPVTRNFDISADGMFAFDRAELSDVGRTRINNAMTELKQAGITDIRDVRIVGHTDPLGSDTYNQSLSEARANAVKTYMASQGVTASSISASGAGESKLKITEAECKAQGKARNRTELIACLAPNRRVEASFTGTAANR
jgi:OOP family OmpA-OmpF porin